MPNHGDGRVLGWALPWLGKLGKLPPSRIVFLALIWSGCFAGLELARVLKPVEGVVTDAIQRAFGGTTPSGDVWILRLDDESLASYSGEDPESLWRKLLERAEADGVATVVDMDFRRRAGLAQVLRTGPDMKVRVVAPSRILFDPTHERLPWVETPFPGSESLPVVPLDRYRATLLNFESDVNGVWRHVTTTAVVNGETFSTLARELVPETVLAAEVLEIAFNGPAATIPNVAAWRFLDADLGSEPPWSGGLLVVTGDAEIFPPVFRTPHGEQVSEPWAAAQLAEALRSERTFFTVPLWCVAVVMGVLFLVGAGLSEHAAPRRGAVLLLFVSVVFCTALVLARVELLISFPIAPVLPTLAAGFGCGIDRRHRVLQNGLSTTLMMTRGRRLLEPQGATLDLTVLHLTELLHARGVAVLALDQDDPVEAAAHRIDAEGFNDEVRGSAPDLLRRIATSESFPMFYSRRVGDMGWILTPLMGGAAATTWLLLEPDGFAEEWWLERRELAGRLLVSLAMQLRSPDAADEAGADQRQSAESLMQRLQAATSQTKSDRELLLDLQQKLSDGLAVCDLIGRQLHHNRAFAQLLEELEIRGPAAVPRLIERLYGGHGLDVWQQIRGIFDGNGPWEQLTTTVHENRERTFRLRLEVTDLTREEEEGQLEVLLLQVSELTELLEASTIPVAQPEGVE